MTKQLSTFQPLSELDNVYTAERGTLRCTAIRLPSGGLGLYSPVAGLGDEAQESLSHLGNVSHLLAPNHYHNKGLKEFSVAYPEAILCCTEAARPRLEQKTGLSFELLNKARLALPDGASLVEPEGLKTGEIWIDMALGNKRLWIVTDAFCGPKNARHGWSDRAELLGTFPSYGLADGAVYTEWLSERVAKSPPKLLVPCHGAIVENDCLGAHLLRLSKDLI